MSIYILILITLFSTFTTHNIIISRSQSNFIVLYASDLYLRIFMTSDDGFWLKPKHGA
jgi:hypothetical protein